MAEFIKVASLGEIPDPGKLLVEIDERILALFHIGGEVFCIDDVCTHDGGPLSDGELVGYEIACPRHGARFDVRSGCAKTMPATENTVAHQVKLEGQDVWVRLNEGGNSTDAAGAGCCSHEGAHADAAKFPPASTVVSAVGMAAASTSGSPAAATAFAVGSAAVGSATAGTEAATSVTAEAGPRVISEDFVREELKRVIDPELFVNIVDLGLVYVVDLEPSDAGRTKVKIDMTMTSPMCPAGPQMISQAKQVLTQHTEIEAVEVRIVMDPPWSPDKMTDAARDQLGIF